MRYAITGSIGTGKSTIANIFKERGFSVYDADKIVHELYQDKDVLKEVEKMFPEAFVAGKMDTKVIANVIFSNPERKKELESFIHPLVKNKIMLLDNCIVEVPLLFESKMDYLFDKIILVYCKKEDQIKRIMNRDKVTKKEALQRINSQIDIETKKALSDYIVNNVGELKEVYKQVDDIIRDL